MNIALLTGRGGSVSLPDKNIIKVLNRPMMAYPALMAKQAKNIDDVYISTDGEKLISIANEMNIKIIIINKNIINKRWNNIFVYRKIQQKNKKQIKKI